MTFMASTSLACLLALAVALPSAARARSTTRAAGGTARIRYVQPVDWSCLDAEECTRCRNVSRHSSDIVIDHGSGTEAQAYEIPAGFGVEVCRPPDELF